MCDNKILKIKQIIFAEFYSHKFTYFVGKLKYVTSPKVFNFSHQNIISFIRNKLNNK